MKEVVFTTVCPTCGTKNKVTTVVPDDGEIDPFLEEDDFHCAYCGLKIGETLSTEPIRTEIEKEEG